jgi:S1-C subfamily serine protease
MFTVAIRLAPRLDIHYSLRGDAYTRKGQHDLALRDYNSAIKLNPSSELAFAGRGLAYFELGDYDRAIENLGISIRFNPKDPHLYLVRGRSYSKNGEYDRAIADLSLAIQLKHPHLAFAYLVRADAFENRGDLRKALSDYRAAVNLASTQSDVGDQHEATVGIQRIGKKLAARNDDLPPKLQSTGSGFAVNNTGHVLTNHHVVENCSKVQLRWPAGVKEASIIGIDKSNDLAILRSDLDKLRPLAFREGRVIRQADPVVAIGFPLTGVLGTSAKASIGSVSALAGIDDDTRFLQISAPIQPGNSGGPLLDFSGNVVGIVLATINASAMLKITGSIPQNVNFALKSNIAKEFLDARSIRYETATSASKLEPADVAEAGVRSTVLVKCYK